VSDDIVGRKGSGVAPNLGSIKKTLRERALRLPLWFHAVVMLTAVGIPLYQWVTFSGLFRAWARAYGAPADHDKKLIFVMMVCGFMLVGVILTQILASIVPPPPDERLRARAAAFTSYDDFGAWMRRHSFKMKVAAVVIAAAAVGVHALLTRD
jgi:hypothetical protein